MQQREKQASDKQSTTKRRKNERNWMMKSSLNDKKANKENKEISTKLRVKVKVKLGFI